LNASMVLTAQKVALGLALFLLALLTVSQSWATSYEVVPQLHRGRIAVPVYLNDIGPYPFLLDAAITRPVIDSTVATYAGLENLGGLGADAARTVVTRFQYGGLPAHEESAAVMQLDAIGQRSGAPVAGLLPAWRPGLELEILAGAPRIIWRELGENTLEKAGGAVVTMTLHPGDMPTVPIYVNGRPGGAVAVDLQYGGVALLPREHFEAAGQSGILRTDKGQGEISMQGRVEEIRVGLASIQNPVCEVAQPGETPRLGLGFFEHCVLRLNFEYGLAHFENRGGVPSYGPVQSCGITPLTVEDGFWRVGVIEGSPAHQQGVLAGDQLISVSREHLEHAPYTLVRALLDEGAQERLLRLHRPQTGAFFDVVLTPATLLQD